jgi:stage II sporulation protein D
VRIPLSFALLFLLFPLRVFGEDVQVRIYSAHPPPRMSVIATEGELSWKACSVCEEKTGRRVSFKSPQSDAASKEADTQRKYFLTGSYELQPENGPSFAAHFPLRIDERPGGLVVVATMPLEEYVQRVLMAESGDFRNAEALKAMAVVARSYAKRFRGQHAKEDFDFCDTTHCQVFDWKKVNERVRSRVAATEGEFLSYQGIQVAAYYHQNCGGTVAAAKEAWAQVSEPYLQTHPDPYCVTSGGLKWETTLTHEQIDRALRASGLRPPTSWKAIEISSRGASGRAHTVNLFGGNPPKYPLSSSSLRFAVDRALGWKNIRSDLYEIRNAGREVIFSGRGSGHGVGLCQAGAEELAREGKSYHEILSFYYPGAELTGAQQVAWQKRSAERFDLISSNPEGDAKIVRAAERILPEAEHTIGWELADRVKLQVFPSMESYRNTTGAAGWVAASTRGQTIRLQPLAELRRHSIEESTLRHELYHLLVEARASNGAPLWFREGLVLYFSNPAVAEAGIVPLSVGRIEEILKRGSSRENTAMAYAAAQRIVTSLIQRYGKPAVLGWLSSGLPAEVTRSVNELPRVVPQQ